MDTYRGNPFISCERPECVTDNDCPYNLQCVSEKCTNPCNCAVNAECRITNHRASCRCPNGYTGDATQYCNPSEIIIICNSISIYINTFTIAVPVQDTSTCTSDSDCPSKLACFSGECKNPCVEVTPCGQHAICSVVDTLPLRTMVCTCETGYVGDADIECRLGKYS